MGLGRIETYLYKGFYTEDFGGWIVKGLYFHQTVISPSFIEKRWSCCLTEKPRLVGTQGDQNAIDSSPHLIR
jgi:hypothetical protein